MAKAPQLPPAERATPPEASPLSDGTLNGSNQFFFDLAKRRVRELLVEAQKRRAKGYIQIFVKVTDGECIGEVDISPKWTENLRQG